MLLKRLLGIFVCLVVAVLIGSSAYQGFRKLGDYERSGRTLGELSRLRGYVADFKARRGSYPTDLSATAPLALDLREHERTATVRLVSMSSTSVMNGALQEPPEDIGQWAYDPTNGFIFISCTHENHSRGRPWWHY